MARYGVVAAGHRLTARAGVEVLRAGGNAVDAAVAAVLTSLVTEPLMTGLGAGGYLLVAPAGGESVLLDFFVEAPGRGVGSGGLAPLQPVEVHFGDAVQIFHIGASSCAVYGVPAGVEAAVQRYGTMRLADLAAPAAALARRGVRVNHQQATLFRLLGGIVASTPQARHAYFVGGRLPVEGDLLTDPDLADALDRLGSDGAAPFYTGDIAAAVTDLVGAHGGALSAADLAGYRVVERRPLHMSYRGREVCTNPPPSAGGMMLGDALGWLAGAGGKPDELALVEAMLATRPADPAAVIPRAERLGSTTHISVLDAEGGACSVTCSNGQGSGMVVPGTGLHLNNMMGEEDLSPGGLLSHLPGDRLPSMMAPTVVTRDGLAELVLGSAGSNRIRSALLQVAVNALDHGLPAQLAVDAPRLHAQHGLVYAEPGLDVTAVERAGYPVTRFRDRNAFFGGCQAVQRHPATGALSGGGDPRRGGAVALA
jgi:gamma-glutamyltranspeptidase/glutathione hydrolase